VAERFETPSICGPYRVVARIGSGGMGTVYEAVDTRLGRLVALKLLHPHIAQNPSASKRFLREGRAAARIRHPHVVQVLALGTEAGAPFLAMELLEGHDLATLLEKVGKLSVTEALDYVLPVVAAVAAAHDAQVLHRDLKPSNVFLGRGPGGRPWPKVVDFGVSAILEGGDASHGTTAEGVVGTVAYLPPEQAGGASTGSFEGDQYALAVLLYECVTGERPFTGASAYEVLQAIVKAPLAAPGTRVEGIPAAFDKALLRAMSRDPKKRFRSIRAFGAALLPLASERSQYAWGPELADPPPAATVETKARKAKRKAASTSLTATVESARPPQPPTPASSTTNASGLASYDGVATVTRGDTITILWKAPARALRARWVFDRTDRLAAQHPEGYLTLMIILPSSAPPDGQTVVESAARLAKLSPTMRRTVIVVQGDSVWQSIARSVLRVLMPTLRSRLVFAKDLDDGIARIAKSAGPHTPSSAELKDDVQALHAELHPAFPHDG
jgi:serine/threonine protein kinase